MTFFTVWLKKKKQEVLAERNKHIPSKSSLKIKADPNENDVKIIDKSYLQKSFKANLLQIKN